MVSAASRVPAQALKVHSAHLAAATDNVKAEKVLAVGLEIFKEAALVVIIKAEALTAELI